MNSSLFEPRTSIKPYEYPDLVKYKDAIRHSYWVHDEFNFGKDVQDFRTKVTPEERTVIQRTMLAIAQIEFDVKSFWDNLDQWIPKPEASFVGSTFSESEVRHMDAYSHLLEVLGLNDVFEEVEDISAIKDRIDYFSDFTADEAASKEDFVRSLMLFSMFVEYVSLFSQFLVMMSFEKHTGRFTGIANAVEATSKEEQIHGLFGIDIVNKLRDEHPDLFDDGFGAEVHRAAEKAFKAERKILDWIFEDGELSFLSKHDVEEYLKYRFNRALSAAGFEEQFDVDGSAKPSFMWLEEEMKVGVDPDFFYKRGTSYSKNMQSVTSGDLF